MMLSTPAGESAVAVISPSRIDGVGRSSLAITTTVLPTAMGAKTAFTNPSSDESCAATTPTTPLGTGTEKLKKGPATGLDEPRTWAILSVQPAYQTIRSIDLDTRVWASLAERPSASATCSANSSRLDSAISAKR